MVCHYAVLLSQRNSPYKLLSDPVYLIVSYHKGHIQGNITKGVFPIQGQTENSIPKFELLEPIVHEL